MQNHFYKGSSIDKRSLASRIQLKHEQQDDFVSSVYLCLKFCFTLLAVISLIRIGHNSKIRLTRLREIQESYLYENARFKKLSNRFDNLFSLNGEQRFMKDQDQMISRDIIRVIWR